MAPLSSLCLYSMISEGVVIWPPDDPTALHHETPEHSFVLPSSPWTYENGDVNPNLEAYNSERRASAKRRKKLNNRVQGESSLPPYHPDYHEQVENEVDSTDESSNDDYYPRRPLVRTGSEGYEARPVCREELLRRYLVDIGHEPGRYKYYIPTPDDDDSDSDTPVMDGRSGVDD